MPAKVPESSAKMPSTKSVKLKAHKNNIHKWRYISCTRDTYLQYVSSSWRWLFGAIRPRWNFFLFRRSMRCDRWEGLLSTRQCCWRHAFERQRQHLLRSKKIFLIRSYDGGTNSNQVAAGYCVFFWISTDICVEILAAMVVMRFQWNAGLNGIEESFDEIARAKNGVVEAFIGEEMREIWAKKSFYILQSR